MYRLIKHTKVNFSANLSNFNQGKANNEEVNIITRYNYNNKYNNKPSKKTRKNLYYMYSSNNAYDTNYLKDFFNLFSYR